MRTAHYSGALLSQQQHRTHRYQPNPGKKQLTPPSIYINECQMRACDENSDNTSRPIRCCTHTANPSVILMGTRFYTRHRYII